MSLHANCRKPPQSARVLTPRGSTASSVRIDWKPGAAARAAAPIGAEVFEIERRNHCRTGVYGSRCISRLLDTSRRADKLREAKNGFKTERFDVFPEFLDTPSERTDREGGGDVLPVVLASTRETRVFERRCPARPERASTGEPEHALSPRSRKGFVESGAVSPSRRRIRSVVGFEGAGTSNGGVDGEESRELSAVRHSLCTLTRSRHGMTARPRSFLRGDGTRRWRNERT